MDELLHRFLDARDEAESEAILERLIVDNAQPLIRKLVGFKLRSSSSGWNNRDGQEVEDLSNEVIVRLIGRLREYKSSPDEKNIANLRSYVAVMAYNASDQYLRKKYPRRFSLKNKVKYILTHCPGLALWEGEDRSVLCGFEYDSSRSSNRPLRPAWSQSDFEAFSRKRFKGHSIEQANPADVVTAVLEFAAGPIEIDDLVSIMAELWQIRDAFPDTEWNDQIHGGREGLSSDPRETVDTTLDHRAKVSRVWNEVVELPVRQRKALLLSLKDEQGEPAIAFLPVLRVASIERIAEVLELPSEELAALWSKLPLDDTAIGGMLDATRQQVANLRKCARERLHRRLRPPGSSKSVES